MGLPVTEEEERRNAAVQLRKTLWVDLSVQARGIVGDPSLHGSADGIRTCRELLDRIERANEWAKQPALSISARWTGR